MAEVWSWARRMAQPFLSSLAETELSGVEILDYLRGEGLGYRMTDFYADLRRYRDLGIRRPFVEKLLPYETVPRTWMREIPTEVWHIGVSHKAEVEVWFSDPETGDIFSELRGVGVPREMTLGETYDYLQQEVPWHISEPEREVLGFNVIGWSHKSGDPY